MSNENLKALRHSVEHVLMQAMKKLYPNLKMAMGPAIDDGFYFDFDLSDKISNENFPKIEKEMKKIIDQNLQFTKKEISISEARELFKNNEYKQEWLDEIEKRGEQATVYYTGEHFADLCAGPHIKSTGEIKAFKLTKLAGAYWHGDEKNKMLTRIYGTAFLSKSELDEYLEKLKLAEEINHRKIGQELELFKNFNEIGQGLPVWLPKGYRIRRTLEDYMIKMERRYGYEHILTPHINKKELFETSGHLSFYKESMYSPIEVDDETYYLKPMNCPAGMIVYKMKPRSYRELPLKMGEFGTVYRYEKSGELHGLQRVRGFTQNDAHIFCTAEQLEEQFMEVMEMLKKFYKDLGFKNYKFRLSLSDDTKNKYVGNKEDWKKAEKTMRTVLQKNKIDFYEAPGEAAFYGPKLDVQAINVFGKEDSISTIQVDFNLPEKFDLNYIGDNNDKKRPFVIHRALIGSFERFFAFLIEYYAGAFPVWLSPTQIVIISVGEGHIDHCRKLAKEFLQDDLQTQVWDENETVGNKIRKAVKEKIPYMLVIGDQEINSENLHIRKRGSRDVIEISKDKFIEKIKKEIEDKK